MNKLSMIKANKSNKRKKLGNLTIKKRNRSRKQLQKKNNKIHVFVFNINYSGKDGDKIVKNIVTFHKEHTDYTSINGQAGEYGLYKTYTVPKNKISDFKKEITLFFTDLKIKNLKILFVTNDNIDKHLNKLDKKI